MSSFFFELPLKSKVYFQGSGVNLHGTSCLCRKWEVCSCATSHSSVSLPLALWGLTDRQMLSLALPGLILCLLPTLLLLLTLLFLLALPLPRRRWWEVSAVGGRQAGHQAHLATFVHQLHAGVEVLVRGGAVGWGGLRDGAGEQCWPHCAVVRPWKRYHLRPQRGGDVALGWGQAIGREAFHE